ncbi:hypothetical protein ACLB0R_00270 [Sphingomonas sp. GlSt437]|uniref:hypothetical protein n=1 Tax=Sphingomonas sp. GlSt437 TaxID=3389970 RepID=UPI003A86AC2C
MSVDYRRIGFSIIAGVTSGLLVAAIPASAATPGEGGGKPVVAPTDQASPTKTEKPTVYCVVETTTGSRIPHRTCLTEKEWAAQGVDITHPDR